MAHAFIPSTWEADLFYASLVYIEKSCLKITKPNPELVYNMLGMGQVSTGSSYSLWGVWALQCPWTTPTLGQERTLSVK